MNLFKYELFFVGDFLFTVYGTDQAIANYIERVEYAYTQADCCAKCTLDQRCLSVNYQRSVNDDGTHTCELNTVQAGTHASRVVARPDFDLLELIVE